MHASKHIEVDGFFHRLYKNAQLMEELVFEKAITFAPRTFDVLGIPLQITESTKSHTPDVVVNEINRGEYSLREIQKRNLIPPGSTVLDLGTNIGITAIIVAKMFPGVRIIGVEAMPPNFACALENIKQNGVADRITVLNGAMSSSTLAPVNMTYSGPNSGGSSFASEMMEGGYTHDFSIQPITVEEIVHHFGVTHVSFIKLDCEGCEFDIVPSFSPRLVDLFMEAIVMGELHSFRITATPNRVDYVKAFFDGYENGNRGKGWNPDVKKTRPAPYVEDLQVKDGDLVRGKSMSIYLVENGKRREFQSKDAFLRRGYDFENVKMWDSVSLLRFPVGDPLE